MSDKLITLERLQQYHGLLENILDDSITDLSVNGKVITYTKRDGTTGTITTQDTTGISLSSNITVTKSQQANITSAISGAGISGTIPTVTTGIAAGIYSVQNIIQQLVNTSHSHSSKSATDTNCNCNCNCSDCH